jgi:hypothetical protein
MRGPPCDQPTKDTRSTPRRARTKSTAASMSFQSDAMVVIAVGCVGSQGAGITPGTKRACCCLARLQASAIAGGRVERP